MGAFLPVFLFYSIHTCTYMINCIEYQRFDRFWVPLPGPSHPPALTCSPYPPFRFFYTLYVLPAPSPTITHLLTLFSIAFYPLPDPSYPPAPACPPCPHFRFLTDLWTLFVCISA